MPTVSLSSTSNDDWDEEDAPVVSVKRNIDGEIVKKQKGNQGNINTRSRSINTDYAQKVRVPSNKTDRKIQKKKKSTKNHRKEPISCGKNSTLYRTY